MPKDEIKTLYHYTTLNSLKGILENHSNDVRYLRATSIFYLNDASEFNYAINMVRKLSEDLYCKCIDKQPLHAEFFSRIIKHLDENKDDWLTVYVVSFSHVKDSASQWRMYSDDGEGYCLVFDYKKLQRLAGTQNFHLKKCIYEKNKQEEILTSMLNDSLHLLDYGPEEMEGAIRQFIEDFRYYAPYFKHDCFKEEQEYRLISESRYKAGHNVKYYGGTSMMVPYVDFKLNEPCGDAGPLNISGIQIGPGMYDKNLAKKSLDDFIQKHLSLDIPTDTSDIPYRNWRK